MLLEGYEGGEWIESAITIFLNLEIVSASLLSKEASEGEPKFRFIPIDLTSLASSFSIASLIKPLPRFSKSLIGKPLDLSKNCVLSSNKITTMFFVALFWFRILAVLRRFIVSSSNGHHNFLSIFSTIIARTKPKISPDNVFLS